MKIPFENTYSKLPENFYERVAPAHFAKPELILFNKDLANELGIEFSQATDDELAQVFSGQKILEGSEPLAQAYAGFQFGHAVPQLGDGRAHLLGEANGFDIQLKGSGQTRFSRRGDGRSALGPVVREYIVSEAMHNLGVPTTRALAAVRTGESVQRQFGPEPGGIFTRVATSHLRVGSFQYFLFQEDLQGLETLFHYTIQRHYPELETLSSISEKCIGFLKAVAIRQSDLIAKWTGLGFIHGVMNTDNSSVAGITIDYGPCAFQDEFEMNKVFSSIDQRGRYSYWNQVPIGQWNLLRLADCLLPLMGDKPQKSADLIMQEIQPDLDSFVQKRWVELSKKLGIQDYKETDQVLVQSFLDLMESQKLDFTLSFRNLPRLYEGESRFYGEGPKLEKFVQDWKLRVSSVDQLDKTNPLYIPRNHLVQNAITESEKGNDEEFIKLVQVLKEPFIKRPGLELYEQPTGDKERVTETFCGT